MNKTMSRKEELKRTDFVVHVPASDANPILSLAMENEQSFAFAERLKWIIHDKVSCFFISPHLDDAIYSAGSLLSFLAEETDVKVVTLFTKATHGVYSEAAKRWLKLSGHVDAEEHYSLRSIEDENACVEVGAKSVHSGFVETMWRRKNFTTPMLGYNPPMYPEDERLMTETQEFLRFLISSSEPSVIFGPDLRLNGLPQAEWRGNNDKKVRGILAYESQNRANFQAGIIILPVERYYFNRSQNQSTLRA
ncbi:MAG: hypothetical protein US98_C0059G0005 [Parcubacteria group bacterium GW2011_GWC1_38_6]|nr:MAG: hypothetical protein US98_C0059G0005 [Parcubacteria group bacterium GW2011_GWC1_38_6]